ncbi:hypothetical protein C5167_001412 [Papaver somniferum]|uniref:Myb/SANT-like DNA-binding domain-containing protein n=2 Tax=Papaver somniferum TaxID=3469 RepID=A0A4Y7KYT6_PAPSO|nr:hypothetical protein C5167_001412 [Papaver somniferum]
METNGLLPGMGSGMLGLEMPIHHPHHPHHQHPHPHQQQQQQQQQQQHPFANHLQQQPHHLVSFGVGGHEADPHNQSQQAVKQNAYGFGNKPKPPQQVAISDEDEPGFAGEDGGGADGRKRVSPWQRVKWTDNMVRLLIMVVYYVGDDAGPEGNDLTGGGGNCKKKSGGLLQKKGKWKSVSRAMMEKGFYVSPQQCEDKFNDLNKRYKRVNDIIGKGTACRVVENPALLETLDHIPPKLKEEVKKLLNSKHLFFREMCAYHNSGGGGGGGIASGGGHQIPDVAVESSQHHQQDRCFHSSQGAAANGNSRARADLEGSKMVNKRGVSHEEEEDEDVEDEEDGDEDEEEEEEEDEETEDGGKSHRMQGAGHDDEDDDEKMVRKKRQRRGTFPSVSPSIQQLSCELMNVLQDGSKNPWEQRQWMRTRTVQLEEQRVSYQCQAFELEKQRLKWLKFSGKKERELERMKLNNERLRLENDRMVLLLRQKELELVDLHQQQHSSSKPTSMN